MNRLVVVFIFWASVNSFPSVLNAETPGLNCNNLSKFKQSLETRVDYLRALHSALNKDQILLRMTQQNVETIEILSYSPDSLRGKISGLSIYQVCTDRLNQFIKSPNTESIDELKSCTGDLYRDPKPSVVSALEACLLEILKSSN